MAWNSEEKRLAARKETFLDTHPLDDAKLSSLKYCVKQLFFEEVDGVIVLKRAEKLVLALIIFQLVMLGIVHPSIGQTTRDWKIGSKLNYKIVISNSQTITAPEGEFLELDASYNNDITRKFVVTEISEPLGMYTFREVSFDGKTKVRSQSFNESSVGTFLAYFFFSWYDREIDPQTNKEVVTISEYGYRDILNFRGNVRLSQAGTPPYLLEPNWNKIREIFSNSWQETSAVLDTSSFLGRYKSGLTIGEILAATKSYQIMGKNSLEAARNALTESTNRWWAFFDLSGIARVETITQDGNQSQLLFLPTTRSTIAIDIEYSEGGILKNVQYIIEMQYTSLDNNTVSSTTTFQLFKDDGSSNTDANPIQFRIALDPSTIVLGLLALFPISVVLRKNKHHSR